MPSSSTTVSAIRRHRAIFVRFRNQIGTRQTSKTMPSATATSPSDHGIAFVTGKIGALPLRIDAVGKDAFDPLCVGGNEQCQHAERNADGGNKR